MRASGVAAVLLASLAQPAGATGFFINQQSVRGLGRVGAGEAAIADSLATIYFNPAGLTEVWGEGDARSRFEVGGHLIVPRSTVSNNGSTAATPGTGGAALPYAGTDGHDPTDPTPILNGYWARELVRGRAAVGLGFNLPFGLATSFPADWFGRYDSTEASLRTANLSAVGAWRFDSGVSVGGGLDLQYAQSRLVSAIPNPLTPGGPTAATDGRAETRGHDWKAGFNIGALFPLTQDTRLGVHYRSGIKHTVEGSTTISGLTGPLAPFNGSIGASADLDLPAIGTVALRHRWNSTLLLLASVDWFQWSSFREVRIRFADGSPDVVRPANYRDAFAVALGAEYRLGGPWTVRGGVRFDQTPTVNGFRDTTVPDADRLWLGLGASYETGPHSGWDFAFTHAMFHHTDVGVTRTFFGGTPLASTVNINGRVSTTVDTIAIGYRHAF